MSNQSPASKGFLLQRYYSSFKFQKKEVFSKVEANVSRRTSHLVGKSSAVLCQRAAQDESDTHCSLTDVSGCDSQRLRVVNRHSEALGSHLTFRFQSPPPQMKIVVIKLLP